MNTDQNAHTGYTAKLWKIVKENGVEVSREPYNNSTYNASPKIVTVGTKSDSEEAVAAIKAALATKDEANIRAVAAANSAEALKKQEEEEQKQQEEDKKEEDNESKPAKDDTKDNKKDDTKDNAKEDTSQDKEADE